MKPRIEKKLSKALVAIFKGARLLDSAWIDGEYFRDTVYAWPSDTELTPKKVRYNRECNVRVNHMPCIGGEADYWGEGTDWHTVHAYYLSCADGDIYFGNDELFGLSHRFDDEPLTQEQQTRLDVLMAIANRQAKRVKNGRHLLAHAREEAAPLRFKEAIRAQAVLDRKARAMTDKQICQPG